MPLYQFRCKCGHEIELLIEIAHRDKLVLCPGCQAGSMKRVPAVATLAKPKHESKAILAGGKKVSGNWEK